MKKVMDKLSPLMMLLITLLFGCEKEAVLTVENAKSYSISSSYTGNDYSLQILYPKNYDSSLEYQTIYLLDGNWYFNELAEIVQTKYANEIVLVGIAYKNSNKRNTDFTYPSNDYLSNSGGGKKYMQFISNELIPYIENDLSIKSSETTLAGHSLGGFFALYQLFQQDYPSPFDNVIAASPSLFWSEAFLLNLESEYHTNHDSLNIVLYNTMGDLETLAMNALFDVFNKKVESRNYIGLSFYHKRFRNTSHNNSPIKSFDQGISFILN